jgi:hypothetical protein
VSHIKDEIKKEEDEEDQKKALAQWYKWPHNHPTTLI